VKPPVEREAREDLLRSQRLLAEGDFEGALELNQRVYSVYGKEPFGDQALFNLGLIYAHPKNPTKDYQKSLSSFNRLLIEFPQSPLTQEARVSAGLLSVIEEVNALYEETSIELEETKAQFDVAKTRLEEERMKIDEMKTVRGNLARTKRLLAQGDFDGASEESQKILSRYGARTPGDEALFALGLIYVDPGNPKRDYKKSISFLRRLVKDFPRSPRREEARIWAEVLDLIERTKQVDIEIEQKKKELTR
jgi:tetratricopeptide (TPR) repeat protein